MTNFLSRLVARAGAGGGAGGDARSAPAPRLDVPRHNLDVGRKDAPDPDRNAELPGGEEVAHLTERVRPADGVAEEVVSPAAQRRPPALPVARVAVHDATPQLSDGATSEAQMRRAISEPRQARTPAPDSPQPSASVADPAVVPYVAPFRTPPPVVARVEGPRNGIPTPVRAVVTTIAPRRSAPNSESRAVLRAAALESADAPDASRDLLSVAGAQRRPHVVPRTTVDAGAPRESNATRPVWSRRDAAHGAESHAANSDRTTVHVTIGRVEIRAPQRAPGASPRPVQPQREGTLEEYLRKRAAKGAR